MLISSLSHAAQVVSPDADTRFYDDIGCLAIDRKAHGPSSRAYVRVESQGAWVEVGAARFRVDPEIRSPMGYNIAAVARGPDAAPRALTWDEVVRRMEQP